MLELDLLEIVLILMRPGFRIEKLQLHLLLPVTPDVHVEKPVLMHAPVIVSLDLVGEVLELVTTELDLVVFQVSPEKVFAVICHTASFSLRAV